MDLWKWLYNYDIRLYENFLGMLENKILRNFYRRNYLDYEWVWWGVLYSTEYVYLTMHDDMCTLAILFYGHVMKEQW